MIADSGAPLLDNMANVLQDDGVGTVGTDIFVHFMPEGVPRGILLLDNYVMKTIEASIPGLRRTQFRIIVRSSDYKDGATLSNLAVASLAMSRRTLSGIEVKVCEVMHDPIPFAPSINTRAKEFVTNFAVTYGLLT